jgi:hypothetical protein
LQKQPQLGRKFLIEKSLLWIIGIVMPRLDRDIPVSGIQRFARDLSSRIASQHCIETTIGPGARSPKGNGIIKVAG